MHIGYFVDEDGEGVPLAAAHEYGACMSMTLERVASLFAGEFHNLYASEISIRERDITEAEAAHLNEVIEIKLFSEG